jgi:hypothetical protein
MASRSSPYLRRTMRKMTPEEREQLERDLEYTANARQNMREILERVEARRQARLEAWLNRPRGLRRLLFWRG